MTPPFRLVAAVCAAALLGCGPTVIPGGGDTDTVRSYPIGIEEAPWQVSLQSSATRRHLCGGSIVSADFVLTAQQCTEGTSASQLEVVAGIDRLGDTASAQRIAVAEIIPFPGFTDPTAGRDLSLLRLSGSLSIDLRRAAPIAIADARADSLGLTAPGVLATATGWAPAEGAARPDELRAVDLPIVSRDDAQSAYADVTLTEDQLAAGDLDQTGADSCQGDLGGPLVVPDAGRGFLLAGVVSWGEGCARPGAPGMYARVSSFADFIAGALGGGDPPPPPPAGALLINEVLADPGTANDANRDGVPSPTDDEFIELVNVGDGALDLSAATVSDGFGVRGTLPAGTVLEPNGVLVVFGGGSPTGFDVQTAAFALGLNNDGDSVTVAAADGAVLAAMSYGAEGGQDQSLVREMEGKESPFVLHGTVSELPASPGTRADGTPF